MSVYKSNLQNHRSVNTPYSERFGPVPRCSLFRGFTVIQLSDRLLPRKKTASALRVVM